MGNIASVHIANVSHTSAEFGTFWKNQVSSMSVDALTDDAGMLLYVIENIKYNRKVLRI